jgi:hypothetical protein
MKLMSGLVGALAAAAATGYLASQSTAEKPGSALSDPIIADVGSDETDFIALGGEGPDVIVGDLTGTTTNGSQGGPRYWGTLGSKRAYSIGTTSCNIGTEPLDWYDFGTAFPTQHPVISQNLYRLKDGRFEQIGIGWLKHGFCALQGNLCTSCTPFCGGCCDELGVGCSDPYGASLNGGQSGLGPHSQIQSTTGQILVWPFTTPGSGTVLNGRIQVEIADLDPVQNPGALYFGESAYIAQDDAEARNAVNNASHRRVQVSGVALPYVGTTQREKPAILAWKTNQPTVTLRTIDLNENGGYTARLLLGYDVTDNGDGTWRYEYALYNQNFDRAVRSFAVPKGMNASLTNESFKDIDYHSGDGEGSPGQSYSSVDWTMTDDASGISWETETYAENVNANALRWSTLYNFSFVANSGPVDTDIELGIFKPGTTDMIVVGAVGPGPADMPVCPADTDGDGDVDVDDLTAVILDWGTDGSANNGDIDGSGVVDVDDLTEVILGWGACP